MQHRLRIGALRFMILGLAAVASIPLAAQAPRDLVLVLDASGSMWGRMAGTEKIVVARNVLGELIAKLPESGEVALVAYGHRREGDCADVETVVPLAALDRVALTAAVNGLTPKGKTPLTASTQTAIDLVKSRGAPATVILVSDGLETCGGDPCAMVRAAREAGIDFVLHVVGFGIEEGDVSSLECAAQAAGGQYFAADDAEALAAALGKAVEPPVEPDARLLVKAVDGDGLVDALVRVRSDGREIVAGRTYTGDETNPRVFGLAAGSYDVEVTPIRIRGAAPVRFDGIQLAEGDEVERVANFGTGELTVKVTRDGELSDALVIVRHAGSDERAASGRSYRGAESNPRRFTITTGTFDVEVGSLEIAGQPTQTWRGVHVAAGETTELSHDFQSGTLKIGASSEGVLVDATVAIHPAAGGSQLAGGRTYTDAATNPKGFTLAPGTYTVKVQPVRMKGVAAQEATVQLEAGATIEKLFVF